MPGTRLMRLNGHGAMVPLEGAPALVRSPGATSRSSVSPMSKVRVGRFHDTLPACSSRRHSTSPTSTATTTRRRPSGYHGRILPRLARSDRRLRRHRMVGRMPRVWAAIAAHLSNALSVSLGGYGMCGVGS
jgi:hypothetical protein